MGQNLDRIMKQFKQEFNQTFFKLVQNAFVQLNLVFETRIEILLKNIGLNARYRKNKLDDQFLVVFTYCFPLPGFY